MYHPVALTKANPWHSFVAVYLELPKVLDQGMCSKSYRESKHDLGYTLLNQGLLEALGRGASSPEYLVSSSQLPLLAAPRHQGFARVSLESLVNT